MTTPHHELHTMDHTTPSPTDTPTTDVQPVHDMMHTLPTFRFTNPMHPDTIALAVRQQGGQTIITPTLASLLLLCKALGVARITPDNLPRVVCRIEFYETVLGAMRKTKREHVVHQHYFTRDEVARYVGLTLPDTMHLSDELVAGRIYRLFRAARLAAMNRAQAAVTTTTEHTAHG